jgi:hypothetical protein
MNAMKHPWIYDGPPPEPGLYNVRFQNAWDNTQSDFATPIRWDGGRWDMPFMIDHEPIAWQKVGESHA